jgi:predicted kinase
MTPFRDLLPEPDHPRIDWLLIEEVFDWFKGMRKCPQDPEFHAEGDVNIHTRMVCEALVADPQWRSRADEQRASLFWAALLHDVAKPDCTRMGPDGRIIAPGHSRRGQIMARQILWRMDVPFHQREQICHLITHHQAPFYLVDRDDAVRRIHTISWQTRCDLLALLARADATGRICSDRNRLLDNIALFAELCREQSCYDAPRPFASAHSRFLYYRTPNRAVEYEAYDDWEAKVTLMSGLPAVGKDAWVAANSGGAEVICLDDLRAEFDIDPRDAQGPVVAAARARAREALRAARPFFWNATNISRRIRSSLIDLFAAYRAKVTIVYLETGEGELKRRNAARAHPVPDGALTRMLDHWEVPDRTECHDFVVGIS